VFSFLPRLPVPVLALPVPNDTNEVNEANNNVKDHEQHPQILSFLTFYLLQNISKSNMRSIFLCILVVLSLLHAIVSEWNTDFGLIIEVPTAPCASEEQHGENSTVLPSTRPFNQAWDMNNSYCAVTGAFLMWCLWDILCTRTIKTHISVNGNSSYERRYKLNELFPLDLGHWTSLWPHQVTVQFNGVGGGRGVLNLHTAAGLGPGEHPVSAGTVDPEEGVRRGWRRNEVRYNPDTCELIVRLEGGGFTAEEAEAEENRLWMEGITLRMHYYDY
jgi:hypothetical protein